jgi:hypothetical protein
MLYILASADGFADDATRPAPDSLQLAEPNHDNTPLCGVEDSRWKSSPKAAPDDPFRVLSWFQGGSGRYWEIAIHNRQNEVICLTTSTIGFRSLQQFSELPLPWTRDFDGDGISEFIYWYSFALGASIEDGYGLSARVYQRRENSLLIADAQLTGQIIAQVIDAYRVPLASASKTLQQQRQRALARLQMSVPPKSGGNSQ